MTEPPMRSKEWIHYDYIPGKLYRLACEKSAWNDHCKWCIPEGALVLLLSVHIADNIDSTSYKVLWKDFIGNIAHAHYRYYPALQEVEEKLR